MTRIQANQVTIDLYNEVINDVIHNIGKDWKSNGGDFRTLQNIGEYWRYLAMQRCNIDIPKPQIGIIEQAKQKQEEGNVDDIFKKFGAVLETNNKASSPSSEEASSASGSSSSSMQSASDSDSDLKSSSANESSKSSSSSSSSSEDDDGLGPDSDDDEINKMVTPICARDTLICQFNHVAKKSKKRGATLNVSVAHFTIDGVPRVSKSGVISL